MSDVPLAFIPSPPSNGFHLGPFFLHAYGPAYAVAVAAAITITVRRWEAKGGKRELVYEVALWGFPAAGVAWFLRIQRADWRASMRKTVRRGGALLAAGGLLALAGCGHSSRTDRANAQAHRAAPARSLLAGSDRRMLGRLRAFQQQSSVPQLVSA